MISAAYRLLSIAGALALSGLAGFLGYRFVRADLAAHVYKARLVSLAADYETLRGTYNEAIKRAAVTELVVKDKSLSLRVRGPAGVIREIPTNFDPSGEIYIDYVVVDQRLWIRRVFDSNTAPGAALVIDPEFKDVDWDDPAAGHGKAVYRRLGEGRWVVSVSGDGSLGLARATSEVDLRAAPRLKDYSTVEIEARAQADRIGPGEVWGWLFGTTTP